MEGNLTRDGQLRLRLIVFVSYFEETQEKVSLLVLCLGCAELLQRLGKAQAL